MDKEMFFTEITKNAEIINEHITQKQSDDLFKYMKLLIEWNNKINLTAITDENEIILKHFIDSITINKYLKGKKSVLDIGTGAGFPGMPLKILNTDINFTLADSLNKRIMFLEEVCKELNLKNISCVHGRAEELGNNEKYREKYDVVTSRAVAKLNVLLEYMLPFVKVGGECICMKGPNIKEEIDEINSALKVLGGRIKKIENMVLPNSDNERNIIVIEKIARTPSKYPRKAGIPSKQPLI